MADPVPPTRIDPGTVRSAIRSTVLVHAVGDILLGTDWPDQRIPGFNPLRKAAPLLRRADLAIGNLEGVLADGGKVRPDKADPKRSYAFRMPRRLGPWLGEAGFDALCVANNHAGDFGPEGRKGTRSSLDALGISAVGDADAQTTFLERNGARFALLGFATNSVNPDLRDIERAARMVRAARARVPSGIVVVTFHGGAEGIAARRLPTRGGETFRGERRGDVRKFARAMVDAGASFVFGHGPHVLRGIEFHRGAPIAYSMGNFATWGRMALGGPLGITAVLEVRLANAGRFVGGRIHPFVQIGRGEPVTDPAGQAIRAVAALSKADFPRTGAVVRPDGTFGPH